MFGRLAGHRTVSILFGASAVILPCALASQNFATYPANDPIEDKYCFFKLGDSSGGAVFDGHGGAQISEYLSANLASELLQQHGKQCESTRETISKTLVDTFDTLEANIKDKFLKNEPGHTTNDHVGACALAAVIANDYYVVANTGDCQAVVVYTNDQGTLIGENVAPIHSANLKEEQEKLRREHPGENDIVICANANACYVKGRLMPSRSFADFHLKDEKFNKPIYSAYGMEAPAISVFTGPYITHSPDIVVRDIRPNDKYLILATDGLWDEMSEQKAAEIVAENEENPTQALLAQALQNAARQSWTSVAGLAQIPPGQRRRYHDDITILVLPLNKQ